MRRLIFVAAAACVLFAGCKKTVATQDIQITTLDVTSLTALSVQLRGEAIFWHNGPKWEIGFQYSTSPDFSDSKKEEAYWESYNTIVRTATELTPSTRYYYRAFLRQRDRYIYGETKEFTTLPVSSMIKTKDYTIEQQGYVTLNGWIFVSDIPNFCSEFGFYTGSSESNLEKYYIKSGKPGREDFEVMIPENEFSSDRLYYKAYVEFNGVSYSGEVKYYEKSNL